MSGFLAYVLRFVPIPIGILAFYMIKSISLSGRKVRIYDSRRKSEPEAPTDGGRGGNLCDYGRFGSFVRDMLIVNGSFCRGRKIDCAFLGFSKLGLISSSNLSQLSAYLRKAPIRKIDVFLDENNGLLDELLELGKTSGILLSYSSECRLGVIRV